MPVDAKSLSAHIDAVRALARALLGDEDAADDVAQDAAVIALESGATVHSPRGWFAGIARNLSRRKIRDRTRRRRREQVAARPEAQADAAELVGRAQEQRRVLDHLVQLDDPYRDVLLLRFFEGLPPREIAKRRATPVETVRTQVRRGIAKLRERLETELRTDDRTWRQGLVLAAGLGAGKRASVALLPKAALAAGVLLAVGGTVWWAVDTLQSSSADIAAEDVMPHEPETIVAKAETDAEKPATLHVPEWVPDPAPDPKPQPQPIPNQVEDVPVPEVARSETSKRDRTKPSRSEREFWDGRSRAPAAVPSSSSRRVEHVHIPFQTDDSGMVKLPAATVRIGSPQFWVNNYARSGEARPLVGVRYEAPEHRRTIEEVFVDLYEITNAQYELYLQDVGEVEGFESGDLGTRTMTDVVSVLWGPEALAVDARRAAYQLYHVNANALMEAVPSRVVRNRDGDIDHERTFLNFFRRELPRGIPLQFFARPIPPEWPGMAPERAKRDHPVVGLAYAEALAFAEWAGKHVPSEFEWEYAARGGRSWEWPWGSDARGFNQRVNGGYQRPKNESPDTVPINYLPEGRSPFGCYHMLGNASEWTSSRLRQYPDLKQPALRDGAVRWVIRGGSANTIAQGATRPMFRGWEDPRKQRRRGVSKDQVATEQTGLNRVPWAGFRCAWFEEGGLSRTYTMRQRLLVSSRIPAAIVDGGHFVGLESNDIAPDGAQIADAQFVPGRAHSLVLQPFTKALVQRTADELAVLQNPGLIDMDKLDGALAKRPLYLGLFHTDWPLRLSKARVWPADPRREPTWYGPKELTGTYVIYYAHKRVWLWHLYTGRQFRLGRASFQITAGAAEYSDAEPKVTMRAQPVRRTLEGRVQLRLRVPYAEQVDAKHLWLDVSTGFDVDRPTTDRTLRLPEPIGR